ncbi:MAG: DUF6788 family protein [Acidimicrobiales bacterium]
MTELEARRAQLYRDLGEVGDFRRGSLNEVRRKCGKTNCACSGPGHPGHGPQHNFTRSVEGRTVNVHLKPGPLLDKIEREVDNYKAFVSRVDQIVEVNEAICEARPVSPLGENQTSEAGPGGEKRGSTRRSRRASPPR